MAGARARLTTEAGKRLAAVLEEPVDWKHLLDLALRHDVAPLLFRSLRALSPPAKVPESAMAVLERATAANALRNTLLFRDLAALLTWAHVHHIDVVVLKGAALADTVYGDRSLRPMRDVDLLIRPEHLDATEAWLASRGYGLDAKRARARDWHRRHDYHLAYFKRQEGLPISSVELHWSLDRPSRPFRLDLDGMWARATSATIAGVSARTLCPEDTVLHLCLHACRHQLTAGLRSYCDIAEVVRCHSARLDWAALTRRARECQVGAFVHVPLALAREMFDAPVPNGALEDLVPPSFDHRIVELAKQAVAEHPLDGSLFPDFYKLRWGNTAADRMQVLAKALSRDAVAARYGLPGGSARVWLRYPHRLAHLWRSYGPAFRRFLSQGRRTIAHARRRSPLTQFLEVFESARRPS